MTFLRPTFVIALTCALAACGGGSKGPKDLTPKGGYPTIAQDTRPLVQVTALEVAPTTSGAIVSAQGVTPTQGWSQAQLLAENDGEPVNGVVTYRFVAAAPPETFPGAKRVSTQQSRTVTAGAFINSTRLPMVRQVVVIGENGNRTASR